MLVSSSYACRTRFNPRAFVYAGPLLPHDRHVDLVQLALHRKPEAVVRNRLQAKCPKVWVRNPLRHSQQLPSAALVVQRAARVHRERAALGQRVEIQWRAWDNAHRGALRTSRGTAPLFN